MVRLGEYTINSASALFAPLLDSTPESLKLIDHCLFLVSQGRFLCVTLPVLELTLSTRLASNSL